VALDNDAVPAGQLGHEAAPPLGWLEPSLQPVHAAADDAE